MTNSLPPRNVLDPEPRAFNRQRHGQRFRLLGLGPVRRDDSDQPAEFGGLLGRGRIVRRQLGEDRRLLLADCGAV